MRAAGSEFSDPTTRRAPTDDNARGGYGACIRVHREWEMAYSGRCYGMAASWRRWLARAALGAACWSAAAGAGADPLFKCVQADGVPSFQSAPCGDTKQQVWVREVVAEPAPPSPPASRAARRAPAASRWTVRSQPAYASNRNATACASAREAAADERERRWREITIDDLRRLDAQVERACRRR